MTAPRIAIEHLDSFDVSEADELPGWYVISIGGDVELEATLAEFEVIGLNLLALVASTRLDEYRQQLDAARLDQQIGDEL